MSKPKRYQLWVHYTTQPGTNQRDSNEFSLVYETDDDLNALFIKRYELEKAGDTVMLTRRVTLEVDLS
jgi:hypothetical protein